MMIWNVGRPSTSPGLLEPEGRVFKLMGPVLVPQVSRWRQLQRSLRVVGLVLSVGRLVVLSLPLTLA